MVRQTTNETSFVLMMYGTKALMKGSCDTLANKQLSVKVACSDDWLRKLDVTINIGKYGVCGSSVYQRTTRIVVK